MVRRSILPLLLLVSLFVMAESSTLMIRVYTMKNVAAEEVITLLRPLLSPKGSLTIDSRSNSIAVKDHESNLTSIGQFLKAVDHPPRAFRINIKMIQATSAPLKHASISEEIKGVGAQIQSIFPYRSYEVLAQNIVEGVAGDMVSYRLDNSFHVDFRLQNPVRLPRVVQLKNFRLFKVMKKGKDEVLQPVLGTTINLHVNQTHVVGVSNSIKNSRALIIVLRATQQ